MHEEVDYGGWETVTGWAVWVWGRAAWGEAGQLGGPLDPPPLFILRLILILQGGCGSVGGYSCAVAEDAKKLRYGSG